MEVEGEGRRRSVGEVEAEMVIRWRAKLKGP